MRDVKPIMLSDAVADTETVNRRGALRLIMTTVEHRDDTRDIAIETTIALLTGKPSARSEVRDTGVINYTLQQSNEKECLWATLPTSRRDAA
jgi:hypothetical protein